MEVEKAIEQATAAARRYANASTGIRVEEVEGFDNGGWDITLSWLTLDDVKNIERNHDSIRKLMISRLGGPPPPLERVYHRFHVREDSAVKMSRVRSG